MANIGDIQNFAQLIVNILVSSWQRITFFQICNKGDALIRKTLGNPGEICYKPHLHFKFPLVQIFDIVNMRRQIIQMPAHSFQSNKTGFFDAAI